MKADIHPDYHEITVLMTNGEKFKTRSTYGKAGDTLTLDVDYTTHPAWTGQASFVNEKASQVAKFNQRFAGLSSISVKASPNTQVNAKPSAKAEKKKDKK